MKQKVFQTLKSEKGEASYIGTFVYILVAAIMIAFIINVFQVISVKQQMDHLADQLVKQIQLNGGENDDTNSLFTYLADQISGAEGLTYDVDSPDDTDQIQIGTPFYVSVSGRCHLKFTSVSNNVHSHLRLEAASGTHYHPGQRRRCE